MLPGGLFVVGMYVWASQDDLKKYTGECVQAEQKRRKGHRKNGREARGKEKARIGGLRSHS